MEVAKRHGVSEPTTYTWRKKFGDLETDEVRRLKTLEAENAQLRKSLVDCDLEIEVMKEINRKISELASASGTGSLRIGRGVSQRRACTLMQVARSSLYYERKMPSRDLTVIDVMKRLSGH